MAALSSGSLGNVFTLVQIVTQAIAAIDSSKGIARDLEVSKRELQSFVAICTSIDRYLNSGVPIHHDDMAAFETTMHSCRECLGSFTKYLGRFNDRRRIVRFARRLEFGLSHKEKIRGFESRMRSFVAMLSIIQTRYCSQELTMHVSRSLDEPWDQRPMRFQDAIGRRYPVPLEVCSTFEGFMNFLQFAFKPDPSLHSAVQNQQFWLFTPSLSAPDSSYLIFENDWNTASKPGARIGMSLLAQGQHPDTLAEGGADMRLSQVDDEIESDEGIVINTDNVEEIQFGTPMPAWCPYTLDTHFELM